MNSISLKIRNILYNQKCYWMIKKWFASNVSFLFWKKCFLTRSKYINEKRTINILWFGIKKTILYIFRAAILIVLTELLSRVLPLNNYFNIDDDVMVSFLATSVSVTGVFLGLYFTAISVSAGKLFLRANDNLRSLFMRNKEGQDYVQTLSLSAIISIFYFTFLSLGFDVNNYVPVIITILLVYGIVRFLSMSLKAFYFLHPTETIATLTENINDSIKNVTVKGFLWKDFNFQNHNRKQASEALETLKTFFHFSNDNVKLSDDQYFSFIRYVSSLVRIYTKEKGAIPSDSYWYGTKQQFQNWILANETEISMALNTGTCLNPKTVKETNWFEETCFDLLILPIELFVKNKNSDYTQGAIQLINNIVESLGKKLDTENYSYLIRIINVIVENEYKVEENTTAINKWKIMLTDCHSMIPISFLLGFVKEIEDEKNIKIITCIDSINWGDFNSIYNSKLPSVIIPEAESIFRELNNEVKIEGKKITPNWYIKNLLVRRYLYFVKKYFEELMSINESFYLHYLKLLISGNKIILAAQLNQRWTEYLNKCSFALLRVEKHFNNLLQYRKVKDLDWPEINFEKLRGDIKEWEKESISTMVAILPDLSSFNRENDVPDFLGQIYTYGVEGCYQACFDNDNKTFIRLFPYVFNASLVEYDSTRKNTKGWLLDSQISYSSEPLVDLLELSGYALIYSELYENKELWLTCKTVWDNYLSTQNADEIIKHIIGVVSYRESLFYMMPRATLRANWELKLKHKLSELNLIHDRAEEYITGDKTKKHKSPLIRVVSGNSALLPVSSMYAFFAFYLEKHPKAKDIDFPDKRGFSKKIETESNLEEDDEN